jgi:hypothetical protein
MVARRFQVVDGFAPQAKALRAHFDARFEDPRQTHANRFVWDLWHVPGQYTALRTPAYTFFPPQVYDAFHQRLVWWGRRVLGCHDVSPPWLSCYVNGCEQRLHGDLPHGHHAFVFSLTNWRQRRFEGGQTMLLTDEVLDFWSDFVSARSLEENDVIEAIEPTFNRLTVFDPRLPHGVRRVEGSMDPRDGRLVIHGWFVQPRPFIEGPLRPAQLAKGIDRVTEAIMPLLEQGLPVAGLVSLGFTVETTGSVSGLKVLADTTRVPRGAEADHRRLIGLITKTTRNLVFRKQPTASRVTLPMVFERG